MRLVVLRDRRWRKGVGFIKSKGKVIVEHLVLNLNLFTVAIFQLIASLTLTSLSLGIGLEIQHI